MGTKCAPIVADILLWERIYKSKWISEYDQEIPQSHTADQTTVMCVRATEHLQPQDIRKTK